LARKGKILVVDDQIFNIDTLKEMMSLLGVDINRDVEEALNGQ
jgi:CheY-like chemotaxis protein